MQHALLLLQLLQNRLKVNRALQKEASKESLYYLLLSVLQMYIVFVLFFQRIFTYLCCPIPNRHITHLAEFSKNKFDSSACLYYILLIHV